MADVFSDVEFRRVPTQPEIKKPIPMIMGMNPQPHIVDWGDVT